MRSRVETTTAWRRRTLLLLGYNVAPPKSGSGHRERLTTVLRNVQQTAVVAPAARVSVARNRPWDSGGDGSRVLATAAAAPQTCCFTSRVVSWEFFINWYELFVPVQNFQRIGKYVLLIRVSRCVRTIYFLSCRILTLQHIFFHAAAAAAYLPTTAVRFHTLVRRRSCGLWTDIRDSRRIAAPHSRASHGRDNSDWLPCMSLAKKGFHVK